MDNSGNYFKATRHYRERLRRIWSAYNDKMLQVEKYRGSKGYEGDKAKAEAERDEKIRELQTEYRMTFDDILKRMYESATSQKMTPPTSEQLAILQALKMRETISRAEMEQAGRTLKDSPVCLSVLDEIAKKMGYHTLQFERESTDSILKHIEELRESAKRLCALTKADSKREMIAKASVFNPEYDPNALYSVTADRDFEDEEEALSYYGGVADFGSFTDAVNG